VEEEIAIEIWLKEKETVVDLKYFNETSIFFDFFWYMFSGC
jgi:hypothetical protein